MMGVNVTLFIFWLTGVMGLFILVFAMILDEEFCSIEKVKLGVLRRSIRFFDLFIMNDIMIFKPLYAERKQLKGGGVSGSWI